MDNLLEIQNLTVELMSTGGSSTPCPGWTWQSGPERSTASWGSPAAASP